MCVCVCANSVCNLYPASGFHDTLIYMWYANCSFYITRLLLQQLTWLACIILTVSSRLISLTANTVRLHHNIMHHGRKLEAISKWRCHLTRKWISMSIIRRSHTWERQPLYCFILRWGPDDEAFYSLVLLWHIGWDIGCVLWFQIKFYSLHLPMPFCMPYCINCIYC